MDAQQRQTLKQLTEEFLASKAVDVAGYHMNWLVAQETTCQMLTLQKAAILKRVRELVGSIPKTTEN